MMGCKILGNPFVRNSWWSVGCDAHITPFFCWIRLQAQSCLGICDGIFSWRTQRADDIRPYSFPYIFPHLSCFSENFQIIFTVQSQWADILHPYSFEAIVSHEYILLTASSEEADQPYRTDFSGMSFPSRSFCIAPAGSNFAGNCTFSIKGISKYSEPVRCGADLRQIHLRKNAGILCVFQVFPQVKMA